MLWVPADMSDFRPWITCKMFDYYIIKERWRRRMSVRPYCGVPVSTPHNPLHPLGLSMSREDEATV
jgi:hypothetical protein